MFVTRIIVVKWYYFVKSTHINYFADDHPPKFDKPENITVYADSECGKAVDFEVPHCYDNSGYNTASCDYASGYVFPLGDTLVTCSCHDPDGLEDKCTFIVWVIGEYVNARIRMYLVWSINQ